MLYKYEPTGVCSREMQIEVENDIIKSAFMQKRKTLLNSLTNSHIAEKSLIEKMLNDLNIDLKIRAEKVSLEEFGLISDYIYNNLF